MIRAHTAPSADVNLTGKKCVFRHAAASKECDKHTHTAMGWKELWSMFDQRVNECVHERDGGGNGKYFPALLTSAGRGQAPGWGSGRITYLLGLSWGSVSANSVLE